MTFNPEAKYTVATVASLLGLSEAVIVKWLAMRGSELGRSGTILGAELERLWREAPPRVLISKAPVRARRELAEYAAVNVTQKEEVQRVVNLMNHAHLRDIDELWTLDRQVVRTWANRRRDRAHARSDRKEREEIRFLRPVLRTVASARGRAVPAWLDELLAKGQIVARSDERRWHGHAWHDDLFAAIARIPGLPQSVEATKCQLLVLAFHLQEHARRGQSFGEALVDARVACAALRDISTASRKARGSWRSGSEQRIYEAIRPILLAAATGGMSQSSTEAIAMHLAEKPSFKAFDVPELLKRYKSWLRAEARAVGIRPQPSRKVLPPTDEEVTDRFQQLVAQIGELIAQHERRGLSLADFARWREWDPELRTALGNGLAAHNLGAGGLRGGSLHGQQPQYMSADDSFEGAVRTDRIIVKRVAREGEDGITTSHDNRPYDSDIAGDTECSTWIMLPLRDFPYSLRDLLEWYLHSCGQCLGPANNCTSSSDRVLRWIELEHDGAHWLYREAAQAHVNARVSIVSDDGEWLAHLDARPGTRVRFNPLWWSRDGDEPLLQNGLAQRLATRFGRHLHRWRHYSLFYLMTAYPLSLEEAALLIHMDPETARKIYNNPSAQQIVARLRERMRRQPDDSLMRELVEARSRNKYLSDYTRRLEHKIAYNERVGGAPLAEPPGEPPAVIVPLGSGTKETPRAARRRANPRGASAFAA